MLINNLDNKNSDPFKASSVLLSKLIDINRNQLIMYDYMAGSASFQYKIRQNKY